MNCPRCGKELKFALRPRRGCSGAKRRLLSKRRIWELSKELVRLGIGPVEAAALCDMAEGYRAIAKSQGKARRRTRRKQNLRPTDHLSRDEVSAVIEVLRQRADRDRGRRHYSSRALSTEMIVYLLLDTGLRVEELCNLRMRNLPVYHGKSEIEVEDGKGHKARVAGLSSWCKDRLKEYIGACRHSDPDAWLFRSERGGPMTTRAVRGRLKTLGKAAGIWLYHKNGQVKTRLSPHKFRHTHATFLLDVGENLRLVQDQLGHEKPQTTAIYAKIMSSKKLAVLDRCHDVVFSALKGDL